MYRVFIIQVTIIAGGFLATLFGSPVFALLILIFLKTFIDIQAHLREHKQYTDKEKVSAAIKYQMSIFTIKEHLAW